jgi:uncharacterized protein YjgD (DUF1641 family)
MKQALAVPDIAELSQRLDQVSAQLQYLTEQAQAAARRQEARAELMHDALPLANDAFELITEQLEEVQGYVDLDDLLRLLKRLLRNGRNLDKMLDQLESFMDLAQTVGPLADDMFAKTTDLLEKAEQKGYFGAAKAAARALDGLVEMLGKDEPQTPKRVSYWTLLRQMRDPEVRCGLSFVMRTLKVIGRQTAAEN